MDENKIKKQWEKPVVEELTTKDTNFGGGGATTDLSNTSTATRSS